MIKILYISKRLVSGKLILNLFIRNNRTDAMKNFSYPLWAKIDTPILTKEEWSFPSNGFFHGIFRYTDDLP